MTDPLPAADQTRTAVDSGIVDETMMIDSSASSAKVSKQEADLAFAVVVLRSGKVSERNFSRTIKGWTIYGTESLADRLVSQGLITATDGRQWNVDATRCLQAADQAVARLGGHSTQSQLASSRIAHIDSSGRISKLLGLGNQSELVTGEVARQLFARFSLVRKLGEGGLGTVWLARDENLRRYVAIKEIRSRGGTDNASAIARFRREAEVTGRLEHPGIVPIYQFGTDSQTGRYFYVMRFLGKHTMQDAIAEYHERREAGNHDPLLLHRLLTAFVKLCESVAHAHSRKVIHRDLKPENVALDTFGQVVLLDWGLAKINDETGVSDAAFDTEHADEDGASLTIASQVLGSPMYMAPEQAAGRIDEIDERTDVYGLGGILFAILTGQAPHESTLGGSEPSSMSQLLSAIAGKTSLRPKQILPCIPAELDAICGKATQQKRCLRYASASDVAEDIERYMAGGKVSAYEEPCQRRLMRWIASHPRLSQLGGLLITLTLLTILATAYSLRQTHLAEEVFRFQQATDVAQELAFHLQSQAEGVIRDTRFMTSLPPAQGIILARTSPTQGEEGEPVWRDQYSAIFEGLLRRNESYLGIAMLAYREQFEQVLKWERNVGAGLLRRVPDSQLREFPIPEDGPPYMQMLPGDVILQTSDQLSPEAPTRFRDALSLVAINSIFDDSSGELFGFMAIQLDLRRMIRERIEELRREATRVYITDGGGVIQLSYLDGHFQEREEGRSIVESLPELAVVFADDSVEHVYSDGHSLYATRLRLSQGSAASEAELGIIVQAIE
jgi:serine/threonine protein kinase